MAYLPYGAHQYRVRWQMLSLSRGARPVYTVVEGERRSSEYVHIFVENEIERWAAVIKAVEIAPQ
jgi:hypothetical protein